MPDTPRGYPYPAPGTAPDVPYDMQQLAEAIDDDITDLFVDTGWIAPTLLNGWTSSSYPVAYRRKGGNEVWLRGGASPGTGSDIFILPVGFRPAYRVTAIVSTGTSESIKRLAVEPDGRVVVTGTVTAATLDTIRFLVD